MPAQPTQDDYSAILEKAIKKAIHNGWYFGRGDKQFKLKVVDYPAAVIDWGDKTSTVSIPNIIFNHEFAKALWGGDDFASSTSSTAFYTSSVRGGRRWGWRDHLQQMVIADDPLKYLGDNK